MTTTWASNARRYRKQYLLDTARGVPRHYVPAEVVAAHVDRLTAYGASAAGIAAAAGIGPTAVLDVINRVHRSCQQRTATALLAVTIDQVIARPKGVIASEGAKRRIRAMHVLGWRSTDIKAESGGIDPRWVLRSGTRISTDTHNGIAAAYNRLSMNHGPSYVTRARAIKAGWLPPLSWDDDTIDDPSATPPDAVVKVAGKPRADMEDVELVAAAGEPWEVAAKRLGTNRDALERRLYRARRQDLVDRFYRNSESWSLETTQKRWTA